MNVLFLALGASRRHVIVAESAQVVAAGGTAAVLVSKPARWQNDPLPDGVDMIESGRLLPSGKPAIVLLLLDRIPRLLIRVCLPGSLSGFGKRVQSFYRRRVSKPVHRRLDGFYRRNGAKARRRIVHRDLLTRRSVELVVVGDAESMVMASEFRDLITGSGARLAFTVGNARPSDGSVREGSHG